jgi:hypothetical protein
MSTALTEIKRRPLKPKLLKAVKDFAEGKIKSKAALAAFYKLSPRTISRTFAREDVQQLIMRQARENVTMAAPRASARLTELIDGQSEAVSLDAVKFALGVSSIRPPSPSPVVINNNVEVGYDFDLDSQREPYDPNHHGGSQPKTIEHEPAPAQPPAPAPDAPQPPMSGMRYRGTADDGTAVFAHVGDEK